MKNFLHYLISLFSIILIASCNQDAIQLEKNKQVSGFVKKMEVSRGEPITMEDAGITGFRILDSVLVLSTNNQVRGYSVYKLPNIQKMGSFMTVGHSINEVSEIPQISDAYLYENEDTIFLSFQDSRTGYYFDVDLLQSVKCSNLVGKKKRHFMKEVPGNIFMFYHFGPKDFYTVCLNMNELKWIRQYYHDKQLVNNHAMAQLNQYCAHNMGEIINGSLISYPAFNSRKGIIAEVHWHSNQIHLYSLRGQDATTIIPNRKLDKYLDLPTDQKGHQERTYYRAIKGYDQFFVLDHITPQNESYLQFYNWNGKPLVEIKIPESYTDFDIDVVNHSIYTLNREKDNFVRYVLPKEIEQLSLEQ